MFVFLTAYNNKAFKQYMSEQGFEHIYDKPLTPEQLNEILEIVWLTVWSQKFKLQLNLNN